MNRKTLAVVGLAVLMTVRATPAHADTYLSPFFGATFGLSAPETKPTFGGAAAFVGSKAGVEIEFATTPNFGGPNASAMTSLFVNYMGGGHILAPGFKYYVVVGAGLLRPGTKATDVVSAIHKNDFGLEIGLGGMWYFTDHVGIRGDLRYFRGLTGTTENGVIPVASGFDFFRGLVGLSARF